MAEGYPAERFSIAAVAPKQAAALIRFGHYPDLDPRIHELVALRASQINGCAFCIDMHWLDAKADGEAVTRIDRVGVPEDVWAGAAARFDEEELAQLLCSIAATNTWNRLQIATRALPGNHVPADRQAVGAGGDR